METRIRDQSLAERWAAGQGPWSRVSRPVLHRVGDRVSTLDLSGRTISCFQHVAADTPLVLAPLVRAGAQVSIAAVNPDSTDDAAAAELARHGVAVWAWSGMSAAERDEGLARLAAEPADAVSDMGGELILATTRRGEDLPRAALEATTSGIHVPDRGRSALSGVRLEWHPAEGPHPQPSPRRHPGLAGHQRHHRSGSLWPDRPCGRVRTRRTGRRDPCADPGGHRLGLRGRSGEVPGGCSSTGSASSRSMRDSGRARSS